VGKEYDVMHHMFVLAEGELGVRDGFGSVAAFLGELGTED
jgi:hypothetical protein